MEHEKQNTESAVSQQPQRLMHELGLHSVCQGCILDESIKDAKSIILSVEDYFLSA